MLVIKEEGCFIFNFLLSKFFFQNWRMNLISNLVYSIGYAVSGENIESSFWKEVVHSNNPRLIKKNAGKR